ncbi:hypothetical protein HNP38_002206 [Chryseobacterium defluvii]|uniref:2TM domain-containing protein n=1 Tax=Chryseobacterium defluvii TaxID=160396 RepID=A0A840KHD2_9FLAO|nr:2TM domain-containing protein [Chryseobacterium defluvii]MBB4806910.1 hypothetical protein [Chryseobacterium defluvii]
MENMDDNDIRYLEAEKKVKKLKNFYMSVFIYFAVNAFILYMNYRSLQPGESIWHFKYFLVPFFWGIGLVGYAMTVFLPGFLLGSKWEKRKIKELMDKDK